MIGASAVFAGWVTEHLGALHRISRAFAEPADQPDLLQELLLTVWKAAPSFRGDSSPATFIHRVAHNRALTWRRRESRRLRRTADAHDVWRERAQVETDEGDAALLDRLYAAIRELGPIDRSLILLALEGVPHREIAQLHGLTNNNVGVRLSRARRRISAFVEENDHGL